MKILPKIALGAWAWGNDGTVVNIPAEVKHWHGAAKDSWFAHLAIEIAGEDTSNEWLEPVSDSECNNPISLD